TLLAVGASGAAASPANRRPGRVYVYDVSSGTAARIANLTGSGVTVGDGFGTAVDVDEFLPAVVVGAPNANGGRGAVFVFEQGTAGVWSEVARFDGAPGRDSYGAAVTVEAGIAVVGQPDFEGDAFVLERELSGWVERGALPKPPTVFASAEYGASVHLDGGMLAVGAPGEDSLGYDSGAVYVFQRTGGPGFTEIDRVEHPSAATVTRHGADVALDVGNATARLLVGSGDDRAFLWQSVGFAPFAEVDVLTPYTETGAGGFGERVAMHGERAIVGASRGRSDTAQCGAAFPYAIDAGGAGATPLSMLHPAAGGTLTGFPRFGDAVAATDAAFYVGVPALGLTGLVLEFDTGARVGTAYCRGEANSIGATASLAVRGSDAAGDADLTLAAAGVPPGAFVLPLAATEQDLVPNVGGGAGTLCVGGSIVRLNGLVAASDAAGRFEAAVDFGALPPGLTLAAGTTWRFQCWYRDADPAPTSNTTDAVELMLR
ncbi:MAG: FG-GAP repeat protein, partial [Planctomycetota bacterium]